MSFRNTFITDFIYQASDETRLANELVKRKLLEHADHLHAEVDERGYGFYAGIMRTHSGTIGELVDSGLERLISELRDVTRVPFRLTILCESGPILTFNIEPNHAK